MFEALLSDLGADQLTLQGVDYPANAAGNANCGAAGGGDMADKVSAIQARCPGTQIVLSGYSQGACVVHNAVGSQGATGISGAVVFGKTCRLRWKRRDEKADSSSRRSVQRPVFRRHLRQQCALGVSQRRRHLQSRSQLWLWRPPVVRQQRAGGGDVH